jgi:fumarate reductase flavoprotein subunit
VERHEIPLATSAHATDLYADADGRVRGVRVTRPDGKTEDIGCDALILACNGYGGSKAMLKKYIPDAADLFYEGHVGNQGDAVLWGEALGASIKDMGSFQGHGAMATPHGVHLNWATVTEGGFHVNANGKRFSNENAGYSEQALKVHRQPGSVAWAIWDERSDAIAMQQASHKEAHDAGADQALRLDRGRGARRRLRSEGAGADLRRRRGRAARREEGRIRPRLHAQAAAQGALLRVEDRRRAHAHPGRAGSEHADARAAQGRHAAARTCSPAAAPRAACRAPSDWGYLSGSGLMTATSMGRLAGIAAAKLVKG